MVSCWCGNSELIPFSFSYLKCLACETLISKFPHPQAKPEVTDDRHDFYGSQYWFEHQENDLGYPNIMERARTDLSERCLHWIRTLLQYKLPPGDLLEIGSAHGGFVALLRKAGFNAIGLEMSPRVVEFSKHIFEIPVLLGPVESAQIEPGTLDIIAMLDVLEHLPDPVKTIAHCQTLLKGDGIFLIQTPRYPEGKTYEDLLSGKDPFLTQLKDNEHLYLFSKKSIQQFLHRLGVEFLKFEQAIFSHYDMFFLASRTPLYFYSQEEIEKELLSSPAGRLIQALCDLYRQKELIFEKYKESEADRTARLEVIENLSMANHKLMNLPEVKIRTKLSDFLRNFIRTRK